MRPLCFGLGEEREGRERLPPFQGTVPRTAVDKGEGENSKVRFIVNNYGYMFYIDSFPWCVVADASESIVYVYPAKTRVNIKSEGEGERAKVKVNERK
jgi:hypothetical protein